MNDCTMNDTDLSQSSVRMNESSLGSPLQPSCDQIYQNRGFDSPSLGIVRNIGSVSQVTGIPIRTIMYYENMGLLGPVKTASDSHYYRGFREPEVAVLRFVAQAHQLGFPLWDIAALLPTRVLFLRLAAFG